MSFGCHYGLIYFGGIPFSLLGPNFSTSSVKKEFLVFGGEAYLQVCRLLNLAQSPP